MTSGHDIHTESGTFETAKLTEKNVWNGETGFLWREPIFCDSTKLTDKARKNGNSGEVWYVGHGCA